MEECGARVPAAALVPFSFADMRREGDPEVSMTDASPGGFGLVTASFLVSLVERV